MNDNEFKGRSVLVQTGGSRAESAGDVEKCGRMKVIWSLNRSSGRVRDKIEYIKILKLHIIKVIRSIRMLFSNQMFRKDVWSNVD